MHWKSTKRTQTESARSMRGICSGVFAVVMGTISAQSLAQSNEVWDLETLLGKLAKVEEVAGDFKEIRRPAFLTEDIVLEGTIRYTAPDELEKITKTPVKEKLVIDGDKVKLKTKGSITKRFSLSSDPAIGGAAAGIRATLQGDVTGLTKYYRVNLFGDINEWILHLLPLNPDLQEYIEQIKIYGSQEFINRVDYFDADGDEYDTLISYPKAK